MDQKRKCLTLGEKLDILKLVDSGNKVLLVAKRFGIGRSTIFNILNNRSKLLSASGSKKKEKSRPSEHAQMERKIYAWFLKQRDLHIAVSGPIIIQKARLLHQKIGGNPSSFSASAGWLDNFKKRINIRLLKSCGESLSSQHNLVEPFKIKLIDKMKSMQINEDQLYNADESGLNWKLLPDKTFVHAAEKTVPGRKLCKQRITFMLCANATGAHKVKPLVISKAKNPRSFKNASLLIYYDNSPSSWMNTTIFKNWFFMNFVPEVRIYCFAVFFKKKVFN